MLRVLDLQEAFDRVVISEEIGIAKPDPAPYQYILNDFDLTPEQALAFEALLSGQAYQQ